AGPPLPLKGPQLLQPVQLRYAVCVDPHVDPYAVADDVLLPLDVREAHSEGNRPPSGTALDVRGAEVSALRRVPGGLELRVFNPTAETAPVRVAGRTGWVVDLRGAPAAPFDGAVELRPWEIATLLCAEDPRMGGVLH